MPNTITISTIVVMSYLFFVQTIDEDNHMVAEMFGILLQVLASEVH